MSKELYVGSLSYDVTEYDLEKLFSVSGRVTSIHLICDNKTGQFMGCGYVRMSSEAEAKDAIASLDGAMLIDRTITVSKANPQKQKTQGGYKGKAAVAPKTEKAPERATSARKPAAAKSAAPRSAKPAAPGSAAVKPAAPRSAAAKPGFSEQPDAPEARFSKSDAPRAGASKPGAAKKGSSKPGSSRASSSKPGAARSGFSKPGSSKSGTTRTKR